MINTLKDLFDLLNRQQKSQLLKLQVLIIIMALLELVSIASIGPFMAIVANPDLIHEKDFFQRIAKIINSNDQLEILIYIAGAVLTLLTISLCFSLFVSWKMLLFGANLGSDLSSRLFRHFMSQDWLFHSQNNSSELTTKISAETYRTTQGIIQPTLIMNSKIVLSIFISTSIFLFNPFVAIVGLTIFGTAYLIIYGVIKTKLSENGILISQIAAIRFRAMSEGFGGIKDTLLLNLQDKFSEQFTQNSQRLAKSQSANLFYAAAPRYLLEMLSFGSVIGLIIFLLISEHGEIDKILPTISIYALAGFKLMPALQSIFSSITQIRANTAAFNIIKDDLKKSLVTKQTGSTPLTFTKKIEFKNITFSYPEKSVPALKNVSLEIPKNHSIALVGSSGSGKSTAIDLLLSFITPDSGEILIDGTPLTEDNKLAWQKKIGYVPQQIFLSDQTIAENIAFGIDKDQICQKTLDQVIRLSRLDELINNLDLGTNSMVGERGLQLSGGQRQRIGIARALYHAPDIIVFDEATSALDGITERMIMESIEDLSGDRTIVMIAHRLSTVVKCDRIYMLEQGGIIDQGSYEELMNKNDKFKNMAINKSS